MSIILQAPPLFFLLINSYSQAISLLANRSPLTILLANHSPATFLLINCRLAIEKPNLLLTNHSLATIQLTLILTNHGPATIELVRPGLNRLTIVTMKDGFIRPIRMQGCEEIQPMRSLG